MSHLPTSLVQARAALDQAHLDLEQLHVTLSAALIGLTPAERADVRRAMKAVLAATEALEQANTHVPPDEL